MPATHSVSQRSMNVWLGVLCVICVAFAGPAWGQTVAVGGQVRIASSPGARARSAPEAMCSPRCVFAGRFGRTWRTTSAVVG